MRVIHDIPPRKACPSFSVSLGLIHRSCINISYRTKCKVLSSENRSIQIVFPCILFLQGPCHHYFSSEVNVSRDTLLSFFLLFMWFNFAKILQKSSILDNFLQFCHSRITVSSIMFCLSYVIYLLSSYFK